MLLECCGLLYEYMTIKQPTIDGHWLVRCGGFVVYDCKLPTSYSLLKCCGFVVCDCKLPTH